MKQEINLKTIFSDVNMVYSYLVEQPLCEAGHRALGKTLAVDLLVTVINPAVCVDATFPASCCILVFSLTAE